MKKLLAILLMIAAVFFILERKNDDIVRIHIRANSDTVQDQETKLRVRDEINEYIAPLLSDLKTKAQTVSVLENELQNLEKIAEATADTPCTVRLNEEFFPEKNYNGKVYPAGEYTALIIEIGEGKGQNWWCVAFPNMCFTSSEKKVEYKSFIVELLERIGIL
jgi:stage II sporulation protein R